MEPPVVMVPDLMVKTEMIRMVLVVLEVLVIMVEQEEKELILHLRIMMMQEAVNHMVAVAVAANPTEY